MIRKDYNQMLYKEWLHAIKYLKLKITTEINMNFSKINQVIKIFEEVKQIKRKHSACKYSKYAWGWSHVL